MADGATYPRNDPDFSVDIDKLIDELSNVDRQKDEVTTATGELRSTIKEILENSGYHKAAFSMIRQINDMPPTKKADCLRTFKPMFEAMWAIWEEQIQDMLDHMDEDASEMEGDLGGDA